MNATEGLQKNTSSCKLLNVFKQTCHLHLHIRYLTLKIFSAVFYHLLYQVKHFQPTERSVLLGYGGCKKEGHECISGQKNSKAK